MIGSITSVPFISIIPGQEVINVTCSDSPAPDRALPGPTQAIFFEYNRLFADAKRGFMSYSYQGPSNPVKHFQLDMVQGFENLKAS